MPWTKDDAKKHKKGLTTAQSKKWAKIANKARSDCIAEGGEEGACDGRAIRIANSQVGKPSTNHLVHVNAASDKEEPWDAVERDELPRSAFAYPGDESKRNSWGYPHHWPSENKLYVHREGLEIQWKKILNTSNVSAEVVEHIAVHRKELKMNRGQIKGQTADGIRRDTLGGKEYLVVPVIMAKPGVMNGVYYPEEELKKFPESWNGEPVVVNHPILNGEFVSANIPEILEDISIGKLFNSAYRDVALRAEAWIDQEKSNEVDTAVLEALDSNIMLEVSTGVFVEEQLVANGEYEGTPYRSVARNLRPDHLAVLPNSKGACSVEDGCGLPRNNEDEEEKEKVVTKTEDQGFFRHPVQWLMNKLKTQELNHDEIDRRLRSVIKETLGLDQHEYVWLKEVFDDYCVYEHDDDTGITRMYKQGYSIDADDVLTLVDAAKEVKEITTYEPVGVNAQTANHQKGTSMASNERKEKVDELIKCQKCPSTEDDREGLMALSDELFAKIHANALVEGKEEPGDDASAEGTPDPKTPEQVPDPKAPEPAPQPKALTAEDVRNIVKEEQASNGKEEIIGRLKASERCTISETGLNAMTREDLVSLEMSLIPGNYAGRGGPRSNVQPGDSVPEMPDLFPAETP